MPKWPAVVTDIHGSFLRCAELLLIFKEHSSWSTLKGHEYRLTRCYLYAIITPKRVGIVGLHVIRVSAAERPAKYTMHHSCLTTSILNRQGMNRCNDAYYVSWKILCHSGDVHHENVSSSEWIFTKSDFGPSWLTTPFTLKHPRICCSRQM